MRIAVLFSRLSGYMAACLRTLREQHDVELLVIRIPPAENAPFDDRHFAWISRLYDRDALDAAEMKAHVERFAPDAIFMSGWFDRGYLQVARAMREQGVLVIAGSDAQWTGAWRQQLGRLIAPWYLHSAIDVLWVAGERQRQFARRLGYRGERCWSGVYCCDWDRFASCYAERHSWPRAFLFVGRYVRVKGIDVLVEAYRQYRHDASDPWPLICAGSGEMETQIEGQDGIENVGFVQPDELPGLMMRAGAFVLPSRREPWGVVVQEAAAAGLPLLCSDACGAAVHLLQDSYNGYVVQSKSADHLARRMTTISTGVDEQRARMGARSHELSKQFTPAQWADTLIEGIDDWYATNRTRTGRTAQ